MSQFRPMSSTLDIADWAGVVERFANRSNPYHEFERTAHFAEQAIAALDYEDIRPILDFKRRGAPGGLPKVVLEGLSIHVHRQRPARYIDTSAQASLQ